MACLCNCLRLLSNHDRACVARENVGESHLYVGEIGFLGADRDMNRRSHCGVQVILRGSYRLEEEVCALSRRQDDRIGLDQFRIDLLAEYREVCVVCMSVFDRGDGMKEALIPSVSVAISVHFEWAIKELSRS